PGKGSPGSWKMIAPITDPRIAAKMIVPINVPRGLRFFAKSGLRGAVENLVHLELRRALEHARVPLAVPLPELLRARPGLKTFPRAPARHADEHAFLACRAQHVLGHEAGHLVHQPRASFEGLLEVGFAAGSYPETVHHQEHGCSSS